MFIAVKCLSMVKHTIEIFARFKPCAKNAFAYDVGTDEHNHAVVTFSIPKDIKDGVINNQKETYNFSFERLFDQNAKQEEVFQLVAQPVIDSVLEGYNGTVFAYGQTGSGKTFTITGGPERYCDRGIIPRSLEYIFNHFERNPGLEHSIQISYLEIYNENGYDLLDPKHEASKLEDLPKVGLLEDSDGNMHLRNLSMHSARSEEDALNWLFLGDTNRMIAETPMNQASTRSHCIFTVHMSFRAAGSAVVKRCKLHLVDLAGSERVHKTGVNGVLLNEAKYINLSLHYLEQVIVALGERQRSHIPYRNSMMTSVLRDSLGGNCRTSMIATCSAERRNVDETMSTCRFAQRVALIKNDLTVNEELDPQLIIAQLRREVDQLKAQLALVDPLSAESAGQPLTGADVEKCRSAVAAFLQSTDPSATLLVEPHFRMIGRCFQLLKETVTSARSNGVCKTDAAACSGNCRSLVQQKDDEIALLVRLLEKEKRRRRDAKAPTDSGDSSEDQTRRPAAAPVGRSDSGDFDIGRAAKQLQPQPPPPRHLFPSSPALSASGSPDLLSQATEMLALGRQQAFDVFRRDYKDTSRLQHHKDDLKEQYSLAKRLGQQLNAHRERINQLKAEVHKQRLRRAAAGVVEHAADEQAPLDPKEEFLRQQLESEKLAYKQCFERLKSLKAEIEHLQHLFEQAKQMMLRDFELWWADQSLTRNSADIARSNSLPERQSDAQSTAVLPSNGRLGVRKPLLPIGAGTDAERRHTFADSTVGKQNSQSTPLRPIPLTGDAKTDADIMAFVRTRQAILASRETSTASK